MVGSRQEAERAQVGRTNAAPATRRFEELMPELYRQLTLETLLENHYRDMRDLEFTIQRATVDAADATASAPAQAMVRIAMEMRREA